jgi:hypothetical protein
MYPQLLKAGLMVVLAGLLTACSGGAKKADGGDAVVVAAVVADGDGDAQADEFTLSGSVGSGSLAGASVTLADAEGVVIETLASDPTGQYQAQVPVGASFPLMITAKGGTDLISGHANEFDLVAVAFSTSQTVNVSPLTTLATRVAECSGTMSAASFDLSWSLIEAELPLGVGSPINPMTQPLSVGNAATLVLANEALREAVRRAAVALANGGVGVTSDEILQQIACDLESDALLNGVGQGADARTSLTFKAALASVLLEVIAGGLHIDGLSATAALDAALESILGSATVSVGDVAVTDALTAEVRAALSVFLLQVPADEILNLVMLLDGVDAVTVTAAVTAAFDDAHKSVLWGLPEQVATADSSEVAALTARLAQQTTVSSPVISISASQTSVVNGTAVTLSWASAEADRCVGSDGWSGEVATDGSLLTTGLTHTTDFVLECIGLGGATVATQQVLVTDPDPAPAVTLSAQNSIIDAGSATTLNWSSLNADQCQASGLWTGARAVSGSESTGALNDTQTFTLSCSGSGGSDSVSVTVTVNAPPPPPPPPAPAPTVSLAAADAVVDSGSTTTLTWSSLDSSSCSASGGWSGGKALSGSEVVAPLSTNTTYTLTCTGTGGNAVAMITVNVNGVLSLSWVAPTENVDGSALIDLAAYRVYYGDSSRNYSSSADVTDPNATNLAVTLASGDYYVAMTALDADGNESAYSNEVLKTTN